MNLPARLVLASALIAGAGLAAYSVQKSRPWTALPAAAHGNAEAAMAQRNSRGAGHASAAGRGHQHEHRPWVDLDIEFPAYKRNRKYGLVYGSGWPLVIHASGSRAALGIATNALPVLFPAFGQTGYLVFDDPDNCLELPPPFARSVPPCSEAVSDETYLEFTPDLDTVGVEDNAGNPDRMAALADPLVSGEPVFHGVGDPDSDGTLEPVDVAVGPDTGEFVNDGIGLGADDDLPGLVLLSPVGVGLVLDADFNRPTIRRQRNLAGFLNSVAYELRDPRDSTSVTAGMVVPPGLFAPIMKIDDCVGPGLPDCDGPSRYQVDGGPMLTAPQGTRAQFLYPQVLNAVPFYELRAFMVSGVAPSELADYNHDGRVTAEDAVLAGYNVISREQIVRVRQYAGDICAGVGLLNVFYADFDGNGRATGPLVCPAGPGQITRPPE